MVKMSKKFWIAIIVIVIIAIVAYVLFVYLEGIINAITDLFQGLIDFFANLL